MTEAREAELMRAVPKLGCLGQVEGFVAEVKLQDGALTNDLRRAIESRVDLLKRRRAV